VNILISPSWNVLIRPNGELGVIDWEGSYLQGSPVVDLVYFMAYRSVDFEEAFEPAISLESYDAFSYYEEDPPTKESFRNVLQIDLWQEELKISKRRNEL